jgi:hypothetical protein
MSPTHPSRYPLQPWSRGGLNGLHVQRLLERWLRRWGFAISGWVVGFVAVGLAQVQVSEDHARVAQAVAQLHQQLAALPHGLPDGSVKTLPTDEQGMLGSLPRLTRQGPIWVDLQHILTQRGLHLVSLRPLPLPLDKGSPADLSSQALALRVQGRFEDWTRVWAELTHAGPLCSIERLSIAATARPTEVQIDAVLRLWLRPDEGDAQTPSEFVDAWDLLRLSRARPLERSEAVLFAQAKGLSLGEDAAQPIQLAETRAPNGSGVSATAIGGAAADALPEDPQRWPLARVRLAGIWQQGADRQAILSAGSHWVKVSPGQRVTQEGHRVAAITDAGVSLRLAQGPLWVLNWDERADNSKGGTSK